MKGSIFNVNEKLLDYPEYTNSFGTYCAMVHRAVGTAAAAAAMAAALFGLSVFLFTENPLKCFIL